MAFTAGSETAGRCWEGRLGLFHENEFENGIMIRVEWRCLTHENRLEHFTQAKVLLAIACRYLFLVFMLSWSELLVSRHECLSLFPFIGAGTCLRHFP